ncbi:hypothetical protein [Sphingomonas sp. VNH70]|uniref:hypothetical protein n=1 Tax=Sphingomonas silueang TaxID=3156617 RepID=UPI0032B4DC6E
MPLSLALAALATPDAAAFIRRELGLVRYRTAAVDLNGDGAPERLVLAQDRAACGSGGCVLYVLTPARRGGFRIVTRMTVARAPVRVLATTTRGWRDLGVTVAGGGVPRPYVARLRFDGRRYPTNPTVAPATMLRRPTGRIVLE